MPLESARSFGRSSRDDRRRRLLTDELSNSDDWPLGQVELEDSPLPEKTGHYGDAEFLDRGWRLLDLVPRRWIALGGLLTAGTAAIVGLEAAYARMVERVAAGATPVAALQIDAKGSLACWFSSLLLLAAAVAALLVYSVRRHRTDDYRGRYRVWFWAAGCWFLMATDQAASLREGFCDLMTRLTGTPLLGDGACGGSRSTLSCGSRWVRGWWPTCVRAGFRWPPWWPRQPPRGWPWPTGWAGSSSKTGPREVMFRAGSEMAGNLLLLAAMLAHARYVLLDAEGLLPHREQAAAEAKETEAQPSASVEVKPLSSGGSRWTKIDPPHATPQPASPRFITPPPTAVGGRSARPRRCCLARQS